MAISKSAKIMAEMEKVKAKISDQQARLKELEQKHNPDEGGPQVDEDSGNPILHAWVNTDDGKNRLWFDAMPECTYHVGMSDLDLVTDTVFKLAQAGLIEIVEEDT